VNELDEESDEAHDGKADGGGHGNLLELFPVRLRASLHQPAYEVIRKIEPLTKRLWCGSNMVSSQIRVTIILDQGSQILGTNQNLLLLKNYYIHRYCEPVPGKIHFDKTSLTFLGP
jgi:hypothetical protein